MAGLNLMEELKGVNLQQYKTDIGFRTLVESVEENLYIIPKYQRKYRWSKEQVTALVESLICGFPIPPIYTCRNEKNQLEILDGQQRVMSLFFYYIGYYLDKRKNSAIDFSNLEIEGDSFKQALMSHFALEELHVQLERKERELISVDYADLPVEVKRRVDYTPITVIEIKIDDEQQRAKALRQIFANLNRGGTLLSAQEQRNGIYGCSFYDMLQEINRKNECWRKLWGREDAKERDMEALLRFCALRKYVSVRRTGMFTFDFVIEGYNGSYMKLLDRFSEEVMKFNKEQIIEYENSLLRFFELFAVNTTQASKIALLEGFYIIYEKKHIHKQITSEIYNKILNHEQYKKNTRQGTVKLSNMNERWKAVYEIWIGGDE